MPSRSLSVVSGAESPVVSKTKISFVVSILQIHRLFVEELSTIRQMKCLLAAVAELTIVGWYKRCVVWIHRKRD